MDYLGFFEDNYNCAGVCRAAQFYFTRSIELGKPTGSCIGNLKEDLNSELAGLGYASLISGILLMFTFICQYCLWRRYDTSTSKEADMHEIRVGTDDSARKPKYISQE